MVSQGDIFSTLILELELLILKEKL
jgi:hypothetical protein